MKTLQKVSFWVFIPIALILYHALVFSYNAGLGLLIFGLVVFAFSLLCCRDRRPAALFCGLAFLLCAAPTFGNSGFNLFNYLFIVFLLALTAASSQSEGRLSFSSVAGSVFVPFKYFSVPFKTLISFFTKKTTLKRRILKAILITVPVCAAAIALLCFSDAVFSLAFSRLFRGFDGISPLTVISLIASALCAFYIFGAFYSTHIPRDVKRAHTLRRDSLVSVILISVLLLIYAAFAVVEIKYLFLKSALPEGITYSQYAREGFFELLAVSAINIAVVLFSKDKEKSAGSDKLISSLCLALIAFTVFLLFVSFMKMWLYYTAFGLSKLRLLVFIFLVFELFCLGVTTAYIFCPRLRIFKAYFAIFAIFWIFTNYANIDAFVAENHIEFCLEHGKSDMSYIYELSNRAAYAVEDYLGRDDAAGRFAEEYFSSPPEEYSFCELTLAKAHVNKVKTSLGGA